MLVMCYVGRLCGHVSQCDFHVFLVCCIFGGHVFCLCCHVIQCNSLVLCLACISSQFWNFLFR